MVGIYHKEVFIAVNETLPQKNKVYILTEGNSKSEFLVTEIGRLTWARQEGEDGVIHGLLIEISGVYGDETN